MTCFRFSLSPKKLWFGSGGLIRIEFDGMVAMEGGFQLDQVSMKSAHTIQILEITCTNDLKKYWKLSSYQLFFLLTWDQPSLCSKLPGWCLVLSVSNWVMGGFCVTNPTYNSYAHYNCVMHSGTIAVSFYFNLHKQTMNVRSSSPCMLCIAQWKQNIFSLWPQSFVFFIKSY